jgi:DNA-directed RNA polymerase III subunit RPC1
MSRFAKLSARWISNYGMTIGISDVTPSTKLHKQNEKQKDDAIHQCIYIGKEFERQKSSMNQKFI